MTTFASYHTFFRLTMEYKKHGNKKTNQLESSHLASTGSVKRLTLLSLSYCIEKTAFILPQARNNIIAREAGVHRT